MQKSHELAKIIVDLFWFLYNRTDKVSKMEYSEILHYIKTSFIRGYAFLGFAILCTLVIIVLVIVYEDVRVYEVDPNNPNIMKGKTHDMSREAFDRYRLIRKIIAVICSFNAIAFVILNILWKNQSRP